MRNLFFLSLFSVFFLFSCADDDPIMDPGNGGMDPVDNYTGNIPIVMIHGTLASGDTYSSQAQRFSSNGYDADELYVFDWNSLATAPMERLDALVDKILLETEAPTVNLVGHSAGARFAANYINDSTRVEKVNKYAHVAGTPLDKPAGPDGEIPTLNLYSPDDLTVAGADIPMADNLMIAGKDHYEIATSEESFVALYKYFNEGMEPSMVQIQPSDEINLSGKVVTLGENEEKSGIEIKIYAIDEDGFRTTLDPLASLVTDANGNWGGFQAQANTNYEFALTDPNDVDFRKLHYYREAFVRSDALVYLRAFPNPNGLAGLLLGGVPSDDEQAVMAIFSANKAIIDVRDDLTINGLVNLSTPELTSADQTTIALFVYDDGDGMSSENPHAAFSFSPFLNGVDYFFGTENEEIIEVKLNDSVLKIKNWKSESEGVSVLVFN